MERSRQVSAWLVPYGASGISEDTIQREGHCWQGSWETQRRQCAQRYGPRLYTRQECLPTPSAHSQPQVHSLKRAWEYGGNLRNKKGIGDSLNSLGVVAYHQQSDHKAALMFWDESLEVFQELGDRKMSTTVPFQATAATH